MTGPARPTTGALPFAAPARLLERIDAAGERLATLAPDDAGLHTWFDGYRRQHRQRLALDLLLLEEWVLRRKILEPAVDAEPPPPDVSLLEAGAVPLLLTAALHALPGVRTHAVDVAPERFANAIDGLGLEVARCDLEREPLPHDDVSFDGVLFNELFEHLRIDLVATLREILRVLRPGGVLLLSTPNLRSLRGLRNLLVHHRAQTVGTDLYAQWRKLETLGHMGHVREYTAREVVEFLAQVGFEVEATTFRGGWGRGLVGLVERLAPSLRPFVSVVARRPA
ncbi:MAG: class I SAM-dependent methyltransferase [Acidobacteriota bacterium]